MASALGALNEIGSSPKTPAEATVIDTERLGVVNGLRGFAILAVIYHHLFWSFTKPGFHSLQVGEITVLPYTALSNGWLGVNLFFLLSGFVLAYPYFLKSRSMRTAADVRAFYSRRAQRLLPLFYFSVVFCLVFVAHGESADLLIAEVISLGAVLFIFSDVMYFPAQNGVLWSLGIEIWFSIVFPFVLLAVSRFGMVRVFVVVLALSLITRIIGNSPDFAINSLYLNPVKDSLAGRLDDFVTGMVVCYLYVQRTNLTFLPRAKTLLIIGIVLIIAACSSWDYALLGLVPRAIVPIINNVANLGFGALTLSVLLLGNRGIRRIFDNHFIQLAGVMTYSIYVWHGVVMREIVVKHDVAHIVTYLALLAVLAALSYRFIEFGHVANTRGLFLFKAKSPLRSATAETTQPSAPGGVCDATRPRR